MNGIPAHVLRDRGDLSPMQAIAHWMCDDPDGPRMSQSDAARAIGIDPRNLRTHLMRARQRVVR